MKYIENAQGRKVKQVMRIKVQEVEMTLPKRVEARQDLPRFGIAVKDEESVTLLSKEYIAMDHPDDALTEDANKDVTTTLREFIQRQNERAIAYESGVNIDDMNEEGGGEGKDGDAAKPKTNIYVAPGARTGAVGAAMPGTGTGTGEAETTIRVSNLTKAVTEDDLRDLFEVFGRVARVALPKMDRTENGKTWREPRGFAYITFLRASDAAVAFDKLQGYGYDHLILRLEWSKPMQRDPQSAGLSGGFTSGYGTKLAQDTKERVHGYTDQSSHNAASGMNRGGGGGFGGGAGGGWGGPPR